MPSVVGDSADSQVPAVNGENDFNPEFDVSRTRGSGYGVRGRSPNGFAGVCGEGGENGLFGISWNDAGSGVFGRNEGSGKGVAGFSVNGPAIFGFGNRAGVFEGNVEVTGDIQMTGPGHADCAEEFDGVDGDEKAEPGTVMVLRGDEKVAQSSVPYDRHVAGVVSGAGGYQPALVLDKQSSGGRVPVALMGKVFCKVDATAVPIEFGDLLTTSSIPGHAMKADDPLRAFGAVIGKALRSLAGGTALIPILVSLQ